MSEKINSTPFIFAVKPSGVSTHRPSPHHLGFVEWLAVKDGVHYDVCHRLDKETSGAMIFSAKKETTQLLGELFARHEIKKEYLFVSDQKSKEIKWRVEDSEPLKANKNTSTNLQKAKFDQQNVRAHKSQKKAPDSSLSPVLGGQMGLKGHWAVTDFERLSDDGIHYLYKALPQTGKTHQIRKHAVKSGIPILGETEYGGTTFQRLMLHSLSLDFSMDQKKYSFKAEPSRLFKNLELCQNPQLSSWISGVERREILFKDSFESKDECLRLLHTDSHELRIDKVGTKYLLGWWKATQPNIEERQNIKKLTEIFDFKQWCLIWHPGVAHEESGQILMKSQNFDETDWVFKENKISFKASLKKGQNFGLFLDQRQRRNWIKNKSHEKTILNLFSFTCGFSLYATLGGAEKVVSVDLFQPYLDWGKENFKLNGLDPSSSKYEFRAMDSLEYLKYAQKKSLYFDQIICDPPSFSRHKKQQKVFRVEKDFVELIKACSAVLKPQGLLFFSTNYEKWDHKKWSAQIRSQIDPLGLSLMDVPEMNHSQWDFEWQNEQALLKTFLLRKKAP